MKDYLVLVSSLITTNDYIPRKCESFKCYGIRHLGNTGAFKNTAFISGLGTQSLKLT